METLYNEQNLTPAPPSNIDVKNKKISYAEFGRLFRHDRCLEVQGVKVNRFMIDIAYEMVVHGNAHAVADTYGIPVVRIKKLTMTCPDFQELLQYFCTVMIGELKAGMIHSAEKAITVMTQFVEDKHLDPDLRFAVAKDLLDRVGIKEDKKSLVDVNNNVNYFSLSPHEAEQIARMDFSEVIDGEFAEGSVSQDAGTAGESQG